jgi:predicted dehydrogenase
MPRPPLTTAHIGAGRFTRLAHAPALQILACGGVPQVHLAAICDLDCGRPARAAALARDFGYARAFVDWRTMLEEVDPDLLVCTVEATETATLLTELIPMAVPIFVEKPQAQTTTDARQLTALAERHGTPTYVAFNRRRMPPLEFARKWAQEHTPLRAIHADMYRARCLGPRFCTLTAIHAFDTIRYLGGEVAAMTTVRSPSSDGGAAGYHVRLQLLSGTIAEITIAGEYEMNVERYRIESASASLEATVSPPYSSATIWSGVRVFQSGELVHEIANPAAPLVATGILPEYERFIACLGASKPADCSIADAERSLRIAIAADDGYSGSLLTLGTGIPHTDLLGSGRAGCC